MRSLLLEKYQDLVRKHIRGIIQIGANEGQECELIWNCGIEKQIYFEPQQAACDRLRQKVGDRGLIFQVACSNYNGEINFFLNRGDESSSVFPLDFSMIPPESKDCIIGEALVPCVRLDDLLANNHLDPLDYNLLYMDTQGSEFEILEGAIKTLETIDVIFTEAFLVSLYQGVRLFQEIDSFLISHGFRLVDQIAGGPIELDAIYVRQNLNWFQEQN